MNQTIISSLIFGSLLKLDVLHYDIMTQRITILLDDALVMKLRKRQAEIIKKSPKNVSFSKMVNDCLKLCFDKKVC